MMLEISPILVVFLSIYIGKSLECDQHIHKNINCNDIKRDDGYQYRYNGSMASEIYVTSNQTLLAYAVIEKQSFNPSSDVIRMDNNSVTTRLCQDLHIKAMVNYGQNSVKEICEDHIIDKTVSPEPLQGTSTGLISGVICAVIVFIGIGIGILLCFWSWKKKQQGAATVPSFASYLLTLAGLRKGNPQPQTGSEETGLMDMSTEPRGSGEEDERVDSIDPQADGTAECLGLDHSLNNGAIQTSKNGEIKNPDVRASDLQAMNRNQRDDPGGVNDNEGRDTVRIREMPNGWAHPKDHEGEGRPLLWNQRAASCHIDMTAEDTDLVNKRGFDPDQVSRCSPAPDADVESTSNMNNCARS